VVECDQRPAGFVERVPGALAFLLPLALYVWTAAPTVTLEDSGEFITAAYSFGIPHPPGYPLWCLWAHLFTWLPFGTIAERVHWSSAVCGAATTWLVYRVAARLLLGRVPALLGALALGASTILWSQSVIAEVYALNSALCVLLLLLALCWRDDRQPRWLYALAFVVGAGMANHFLLALAALPVLGLLLWVDWRALLRVRVLVVGTLLLALGLSVYAYLPLRAATDPPVNVGTPRTIARAVAHVRRDVYSTAIESQRTAGGARDVLLHTRDAWVDAAGWFGWPFAALAVLGIVAWPRGARDVLLTTIAITLCNTLVLNAQLHAPHSTLWAYVHRVYYLQMHAMIALWIASGVHALLRTAARRSAMAPRLVEGAVAIALVWSVVRGYGIASHRGDFVGRDLALDLLDSAPPRAGFLPVGDSIIYPVLYARHVEGLRPDVNLISHEYGWRGEPYSALLAGSPLSDAMRDAMPGLRDRVAVPRGLVFALEPGPLPPMDARSRWASFVPLPAAPRDAGLDHASNDLFVDAVRAVYAQYYARLGARSLARGDEAAGMAALDRAEALDPGDPHVAVLLFDVYRDFDVREQRWRPLLERALAEWDRTFDPHDARFDALQRRDIEQRLTSLDATVPTDLPRAR
jgi:4-amino-4-deoxy-L-arabinose transferase-like glycosyltransferase